MRAPLKTALASWVPSINVIIIIIIERESPAGVQFWKFSRQRSIFGRIFDQWVAILSPVHMEYRVNLVSLFVCFPHVCLLVKMVSTTVTRSIQLLIKVSTSEKGIRWENASKDWSTRNRKKKTECFAKLLQWYSSKGFEGSVNPFQPSDIKNSLYWQTQYMLSKVVGTFDEQANVWDITVFVWESNAK